LSAHTGGLARFISYAAATKNSDKTFDCCCRLMALAAAGVNVQLYPEPYSHFSFTTGRQYHHRQIRLS
jgi:hypothetical protein